MNWQMTIISSCQYSQVQRIMLQQSFDYFGMIIVVKALTGQM